MWKFTHSGWQHSASINTPPIAHNPMASNRPQQNLLESSEEWEKTATMFLTSWTMEYEKNEKKTLHIPLLSHECKIKIRKCRLEQTRVMNIYISYPTILLLIDQSLSIVLGIWKMQENGVWKWASGYPFNGIWRLPFGDTNGSEWLETSGGLDQSYISVRLKLEIMWMHGTTVRSNVGKSKLHQFRSKVH